MQTNDLYWLAGLIEGEGCFSLYKKNSTPIMAIAMTDLDVIVKARTLLNFSRPIVTIKRNNCKDYYKLTVTNKKAISWMMTLYPLMGIRRKARIKEILNIWRPIRTAYDTHGTCKYGHIITTENTITEFKASENRVIRKCRLCSQISNKATYHRRKLKNQEAVFVGGNKES